MDYTYERAKRCADQPIMGGFIKMTREMPEATTLADLLQRAYDDGRESMRVELDRPHTILFAGDGWEIQHEIACRDDMLGCPVNVACSRAWDHPRDHPRPAGRWLITVENGKPVIGEMVS